MKVLAPARALWTPALSQESGIWPTTSWLVWCSGRTLSATDLYHQICHCWHTACGCGPGSFTKKLTGKIRSLAGEVRKLACSKSRGWAATLVSPDWQGGGLWMECAKSNRVGHHAGLAYGII